MVYLSPVPLNFYFLIIPASIYVMLFRIIAMIDVSFLLSPGPWSSEYPPKSIHFRSLFCCTGKEVGKYASTKDTLLHPKTINNKLHPMPLLHAIYLGYWLWSRLQIQTRQGENQAWQSIDWFWQVTCLTGSTQTAQITLPNYNQIVQLNISMFPSGQIIINIIVPLYFYHSGV